MTRVVLYLLALLTGFSGAEAARTVSVAEQGAAIALASSVATNMVSVAQEQPHQQNVAAPRFRDVPAFRAEYQAAPIATVQRSDRTRE